ESLLALYTKIRFEYHAMRRTEAAVVAAYQQYKQEVWKERRALMTEILRLRLVFGLGAKRIAAHLAGQPGNLRFIERTIYSKAERAVRVSENFLPYPEFRTQVTQGLGERGLGWETIKEIRPRPSVHQ